MAAHGLRMSSFRPRFQHFALMCRKVNYDSCDVILIALCQQCRCLSSDTAQHMNGVLNLAVPESQSVESVTSEKPIILIAKQTANRELFLRSLDAVSMTHEFVEQLSDFHSAQSRLEASVVVHVLEGFERNEVAVFQHRLVRSEQGRQLARFLIYRGTNERAISFAADLGMLRALQAEQAHSTLGYTLRLALKGYFDLEPDLRSALELTAAGDCCSAPEQLENVRALSKRYPLVENLAIASAYVGLILDGDAEAAIRKGHSILSRSPENVRAMTLVGEGLLMVKEYDAAAKILMRAETFAAGNPTRLALIGRIAAATGAVDSAKKCLIKSLEICPVLRSVKPLIASLEFSPEEKKSVTDLLAMKFSADEITSMFEK